jgi:hypothetical protein
MLDFFLQDELPQIGEVEIDCVASEDVANNEQVAVVTALDNVGSATKKSRSRGKSLKLLKDAVPIAVDCTFESASAGSVQALSTTKCRVHQGKNMFL